jgi:hypothetical protein
MKTQKGRIWQFLLHFRAAKRHIRFNTEAFMGGVSGNKVTQEE